MLIVSELLLSSLFTCVVAPVDPTSPVTSALIIYMSKLPSAVAVPLIVNVSENNA